VNRTIRPVVAVRQPDVVAALHADLLDQRVDESLAQRQRERPVALRPN
jgi:Pyruvate/2-oxoacid:ferredoxin oxidoreductase gamma subunit